MELEAKYLNPYTDFGFKKLFGSEPNKDLLIDFLNQLLPPQHKIKDLTYTTSERLGLTITDRYAIFDLFCISQSGERFIVEMQKVEQNYFKDRSLFYASFPIQEQGRRNKRWNFKLAAVYLVGILDFVFDDKPRDNEVVHTVQLKDQLNRVFYDKLTFIYLEMPKFKKTEGELKTLFDKWLYVLKHLPELQARPAKLRERVFGKLFKTAELEKFNREERMQYEGSLMVYRDLINVVSTAKKKGRAGGRAEGRVEGLAQGLAEGRAEGEVKGRVEGERQKTLDVARRLIAANVVGDLIANVTGLTETQIESLREESR